MTWVSSLVVLRVSFHSWNRESAECQRVGREVLAAIAYEVNAVGGAGPVRLAYQGHVIRRHARRVPCQKSHVARATLKNLAIAYRAMGRLADAAPLFERDSLAARKCSDGIILMP
jgi:hypothetical protein